MLDRTKLSTAHSDGTKGQSVLGIRKDLERESTPELSVTRGMKISPVIPQQVPASGPRAAGRRPSPRSA